MAIEQATLWDKVKELVLEQYKSSPNLKGLIQSVVEECAQPIDDAAFSIQDFFDVSKATAGWLDILGKYVSLERNPGESDESFRERIEIEVSTSTAGTPDNIIFKSAILSRDTKPQYMDEAPATFFVYTPNGNQMKRADVKKLAPCGVLGLPGAAIKLGNGNLLGCANGKLLLTVARDYRKNLKPLLVTDAGKVLSTDAGKMLYAEISD